MKTRYFGEIPYAEEGVIRTPRGVPGFESETRFLLIQLPGQYPLVYLQSMCRPDLCFPALPVRVAERGYELEISDEDSGVLGIANQPQIGAEVLCLALLAADESHGATANLMAPVVVNLESRVALQCINGAGDYLCRHPLQQVVAA